MYQKHNIWLAQRVMEKVKNLLIKANSDYETEIESNSEVDSEN